MQVGSPDWAFDTHLRLAQEALQKKTQSKSQAQGCGASYLIQITG